LHNSHRPCRTHRSPAKASPGVTMTGEATQTAATFYATPAVFPNVGGLMMVCAKVFDAAGDSGNAPGDRGNDANARVLHLKSHNSTNSTRLRLSARRRWYDHAGTLVVLRIARRAGSFWTRKGWGINGNSSSSSGRNRGAVTRRCLDRHRRLGEHGGGEGMP
jgi:hypothetical protein